MAIQNDSEKYAYLDQLSTERLEELIRADVGVPDNTNDEVIFHILEVIKKREQKHPTGRLIDVDEAWAEFQQYYNIPEGEGLSLYPTESEDEPEQAAKERTQCVRIIRLRPALKVVSIVAAVVIGILSTMAFTQAAGFDVFGAIGRWTEETSHFMTSSGEATQNGEAIPNFSNSSSYIGFQTALDACGIKEDLVPTWCLEGFKSFERNISNNDFGD